MDLNEIQQHIERLNGCPTELLHYRRFGAILRVHLNGGEDDEWILSFGLCTYLRGPTYWEMGNVTFVTGTDGSLVVEDLDNGFRVVCQTCHLIPEDDYCGE